MLLKCLFIKIYGIILLFTSFFPVGQYKKLYKENIFTNDSTKKEGTDYRRRTFRSINLKSIQKIKWKFNQKYWNRLLLKTGLMGRTMELLRERKIRQKWSPNTNYKRVFVDQCTQIMFWIPRLFFRLTFSRRTKAIIFVKVRIERLPSKEILGIRNQRINTVRHHC